MITAYIINTIVRAEDLVNADFPRCKSHPNCRHMNLINVVWNKTEALCLVCVLSTYTIYAYSTPTARNLQEMLPLV